MLASTLFSYRTGLFSLNVKALLFCVCSNTTVCFLQFFCFRATVKLSDVVKLSRLASGTHFVLCTKLRGSVKTLPTTERLGGGYTVCDQLYLFGAVHTPHVGGGDAGAGQALSRVLHVAL